MIYRIGQPKKGPENRGDVSHKVAQYDVIQLQNPPKYVGAEMEMLRFGDVYLQPAPIAVAGAKSREEAERTLTTIIDESNGVLANHKIYVYPTDATGKYYEAVLAQETSREEIKYWEDMGHNLGLQMLKRAARRKRESIKQFARRPGTRFVG